VPMTEIVLYRDEHGRCPVREWLEELQAKDRRGFAKCVALINQLHEFGHELRRPIADMLRDGIYELRGRQGNVHYRILYFFSHGLAVLAHALKKDQSAVPPSEIDRAVKRKRLFDIDPDGHTYEDEE
jgi:phage-related protein